MSKGLSQKDAAAMVDQLKKYQAENFNLKRRLEEYMRLGNIATSKIGDQIHLIQTLESKLQTADKALAQLDDALSAIRPVIERIKSPAPDTVGEKQLLGCPNCNGLKFAPECIICHGSGFVPQFGGGS